MEDIAIGSPNSYSSSSSSANSLDGRAVVNNTSLQAYLAGPNNNQASSATAESSKSVLQHQQQQKAPKRKKGEKSTTIQTACVYCRGSKMKCIRNNELESCKRCVAAGIKCETKARRSGRRPGSGSKQANTSNHIKLSNASTLRTPQLPVDPPSTTLNSTNGSENFIRQKPSEQTSHINIPALPPLDPTRSQESPSYASQTSYQSFSDNGQAASHPQVPGVPYFAGPAGSNTFLTSPAPLVKDPGLFPHTKVQHTQSTNNGSSALPLQANDAAASATSIQHLLSNGDGSVALHLNESSKDQPQSFTRSPLALLAAAGAADPPFYQDFARQQDLVRPGPRSLVGHLVNHTNYFSSATATQLLDYDHENDPIWKCIVTEEEASCLLDVYWMHLQPLVLLLDSRLHSLTHVRSRSTFLFTAMMTSAAKFVPGCAAAAQRLDEHAKKLVAKVVLDGNVSLDTVQAFCILCPWLDPGTHVALDTTSTYLSLAYDKFKRIPNDFGWGTQHERLLARSYERTYLTLYNYDRGSALVMGEPLGFTIAERKDLVGAVWQWAAHSDAVQGDWTLSAMVALRRDVPGVLSAVTRQGSSHTGATSTQPSPQIIRVVISEFLTSWQSVWLPKATNVAYLSIVGHHTTLSILITTLKEHVGQPTETAVLQQALLAALQTLQAFVAPDQSVLTYLVNNTFVMIAYAAAFVLKVLVQWSDVGSAIETSIYVLLSQVERRLCDLGSYPSHRLGRSRIYGLQLGHVLRNQLQTRLPTRQPTPEAAEENVKAQQAQDPTLTMPPFVNDMNGMFNAAPSSGLSSFFKNGDLPGANLDVAHMSVEEMTELLKSDYWLPLESNDFFDTSNFFSNVVEGASSSMQA